ncbi:11908_t:CDS:2 [Funneliformis mosseae]|uniref:11908_t:CDS:1 n=1 Tax=Funneliformis mosseae TaxID=27381 RepID=A0A9N8YP92_FUNMO|nr:11908_t:CDS:2 [Funneliformis mosseae]
MQQLQICKLNASLWSNLELIIEQVLALITIVDQYANFLKIVNDHMYKIHYSDVSARDSSINLEVYTIDADSNNIIKEIYKELANA